MARHGNDGKIAPHRVVVRRLRPGEMELFQAHLLALDPQSRRLRFGGSAVTDAFLRGYAARVPQAGTVIKGAFVDGLLRGVGELRPLGDRTEAEVAFSVEPEWRRRGVGQMLLRQLVLFAQNHGVATLRMVCLPENAAMQRLARRLGGRLVSAPGEVQALIVPTGPTPFSLVREALGEAGRVASRLFDAWNLPHDPPLARGA